MGGWRWCVMMLAVAASLQAQSVADGIEAFHRGRYAEARQMLERVVAASPNDAAARTFLALSRAATGACDAARAELEQQFTNNSEASLRRLAGIALVQCGLARNRLADVWPVLNQLQKSFPDDADVLYETARVHMKAWNDAVFQMHQKTPASFRVNQLSGEIFETQARYQEAAAEYRKAIQKNPTALNLHYRLGRALLLQSHEPANLREARKEFEAELALNPSDAVAEYQVGQILQAEQNPALAAARFEKAASARPEFRGGADRAGEDDGRTRRSMPKQSHCSNARSNCNLRVRRRTTA